MPFDDAPGDHVETGPDQRRTVVANVPERQGVTGHHVRYVLLVGMAAIVTLFGLYLALVLSEG